MITVVKIVLQVIGLATVIWFVWIATEEFIKIKRKEDDNG